MTKPVALQQAFVLRTMQNHFELFHLPQRFTLDTSALERAYHEVQNQTHPDRFASASSAEKRVAMQWTTRANEAYQTLKSPFKRAAYLCELNGVELQAESNTAMPAAFLMQQMEWRETLDDARAAKSMPALEQLDSELRAARKVDLERIGTLLDAQDFQQAAQYVRQLMFLDKFGEEIGNAFAVLES
ncbi:Co-chaperone protein HscB [Collimonas sp. OK607]|nr:Co-chaperone protein HscB [Collimonas sp. OK607]